MASQMLDIEVLNQALSFVEDIGKKEYSFTINGIPITLRALMPEEEIEAQRYASLVYEDLETDSEGDPEASPADTVEYINRFRLAILSYAIIEINGVSLRNNLVNTSETLADGTAISTPKYQVTRKLLQEKISSTLREMIFNKYGELLKQIEQETDSMIEYTPSDLEGEIEELEARLTELKALLAKQKKEQQGDLDLSSLPEIDLEQLQKEREEALQQLEQEQKEESFQPSPALGESYPSQAPPTNPHLDSEDLPYETRRPFLPESSEPPASPNPQVAQNYYDRIPDSMMRSGTEQDAIYTETIRLQRERAARMQQEPQTSPQHQQSLQALKGMVPPHAAAAQASSEIEEQYIDPVGDAMPIGGIDDAFVLPTHVIDQLNQRSSGPLVVNPSPSSPQSLNPRFRPPKGSK